MPYLVPIVLAMWVAGTVALFAKCRGRDAALVSMIAGWAFLPTEVYPPNVFFYPVGSGGSVHALAVPTPVLMNKATAIGLGCLAGMMIFDWPMVRRLRPGWVDLPIVAWCVVPVISAFANGLSLPVGLGQTRYLALAWGVPYLAGRVYLGDSESLRRLGVGLVLAGLLYAPLCLLEFLFKPFLYSLVYGPHPYQVEGAVRALGYRPMGFLEHGNQLGLWAAVSAVAAAWLAGSGGMSRVLNVPGRFVAIGLIGFCLLDQSHGAIVLMAIALSVFAALKWGRGVWSLPPGAGATVAAVLTVAAVAAAVGLSGGSGARGRLKGVAVMTGKVSFTWRLARYENYLSRAAERPAFGWSRADWSQAPDHGFVNPVNLGLWLHALGMFGAVGLVASTAVFVGPVIEVARWLPPRAWLNPPCSPVTLVAVLLLVGLGDSLLNSTVLLPMLAGAGGLNSWSERRGRGS